jgi:hypothetical protein
MPRSSPIARVPGPPEVSASVQHKYFAFTDPSGGGPDEFSLAIGHFESDTVVVDVVRGRRGSPANVVNEYASLLRTYGIWQVVGDRYAGSWPGDEFMRYAIRYSPAPMDRSGLYVELLAGLNSQRVQLPPDQKLRRQLIALERRTGSSGRDTIDHPPNGHDDLANAVAGLYATMKRPQGSTKSGRLRGLM